MARPDLRSLSRQVFNLAIVLRQNAAQSRLLHLTSQRIRLLAETRWPGANRNIAIVIEQKNRVSPTTVRDNSDVARHISEVVSKRLDRLSKAKDFDAASDPVEALHDLRVASRRLRAFVDLFEPLAEPKIGRRAKKHLRRITRAVRTVRDWDVQLGILRDRLKNAAGEVEQIALEDLLVVIAKYRARELKIARRRLGKLDTGDIALSLNAILGVAVTGLPHVDDSGARHLGPLIEPFLQPQPHELRKLIDKPRALHDFRIQLKKLRYTLELMEPALGESYHRLYAPVEEMQDLLGKHQDLVVFDNVISRRRRQLEKQGRFTLAHCLWVLGKKAEDERQGVLDDIKSQSFDIETWRQSLRQQLT